MNEYKIKDDDEKEVKVKAKYFEVDTDGYLLLYGNPDERNTPELLASFARNLWINIIKVVD